MVALIPMPTPESRALSFQAQMAQENLAVQTGNSAATLFEQDVPADQATAMYLALMTSAMAVMAGLRYAYLNRFMELNGLQPDPIDLRVLRTPPEVAVADGLSLSGAVASVQRSLDRWEQQSQGALERAPRQMAGDQIRSYAEATLTSYADQIDREVMGRYNAIVALRRVAHPTACARCLVVSGVLVFKSNPQLRHEQCRCSFEPVLVNDADYQARLERWRANAGYARPGDYGRDRRARGRAQLEDAAYRESSEVQQELWRDYLRYEQSRLSSLVRTVQSDTYRDWAVMVSANASQAVGGDFLPVLTRN